MKTLIKQLSITIFLLFASQIITPVSVFAQDNQSQALDQNISIYAEDEPLSNVIEKICKYLNIDYSYNSSIIADKKISLNISNKPIKFVLDKLMKDFYLLFEIEDNILVVRDYVPLDKSIDLENNTNQFLVNNRGFLFDNPKKKSITIKFKSRLQLTILTR